MSDESRALHSSLITHHSSLITNMYFLSRFLKVFAVTLIFTGIGALVFYMAVISGSKPRSDVSQEEFASTVRLVVGGWMGFMIFLSFLLAATGMRKTISVPVYDP